MLAVYGAPYTSQAPQTALFFARAAIQRGHEISRVFFYQRGVQIASSLSVVSQGEMSLRVAWSEFAVANNTELIVCISAAMREGLVSREEARHQGLSQWNVESPFTLSGLGQFVDSMVTADRFVVFGA